MLASLKSVLIGRIRFDQCSLFSGQNLRENKNLES